MQFGISVSCPWSQGFLPEEIRTKQSSRPSGVSKGGHLVGIGSSCWSRSHGSQASLFFSVNSESCSPFLQLFTIPICSSLVDISDICHGLKSRASLFKTFSPPLSRERHHLSFIFTVPGNSDKNPSLLFSSQWCPLLPHHSLRCPLVPFPFTGLGVQERLPSTEPLAV